MSHPRSVLWLYKTILRLHKGLPDDLQDLGTKYVRGEFRRHMKCSPEESRLFLAEWANYASTLCKQLGLKGKQQQKLGCDIDPKIIEILNNDQIIQLYELMKATKETKS